MPRSKEIPEDIKEKVVCYHQSGKGYKSISKMMGLHLSTVKSIISKWKNHGTVMNLPRSGRPTKISPQVQCKIIQEVSKKPDITFKELQASLALTKVNVHESTIRKRLCKIRHLGSIVKQEPLQKKIPINALVLKKLQDDSQVCEERIKTEVAEVEVYI